MPRDISSHLKFKQSLARYFRQLSIHDIINRSCWMNGIDEVILHSVVTDLAKEIDMTDLTIWDEDIMRASYSGRESFDECVVPELMTIKDKPQFWNMAKSPVFYIDGAEDMAEYKLPYTPKGYYNDGIFITSRHFSHPEDRQFIIFMMFAFPDLPDYIKDSQPFIIGSCHEINKPINFSNPLLASLAFLTEPIVEVLPHEIDRSARRRIDKLYRHSSAPAINKVILRRRITGQTRTTETDREWHCRWLVGGHWRRQYYPKTNEHKPKYIAPYVKGPDDLPLKAPSTTVFVAKR